jgi:hypothetical protein
MRLLVVRAQATKQFNLARKSYLFIIRIGLTDRHVNPISPLIAYAKAGANS